MNQLYTLLFPKFCCDSSQTAEQQYSSILKENWQFFSLYHRKLSVLIIVKTEIFAFNIYHWWGEWAHFLGIMPTSSFKLKTPGPSYWKDITCAKLGSFNPALVCSEINLQWHHLHLQQWDSQCHTKQRYMLLSPVTSLDLKGVTLLRAVLWEEST